MEAGLKPCIVVSAVNLVEGGALAVVHDALQTLSEHFAAQYDIIALVHRKSLFVAKNVTYLEFPDVKKSWGKRLLFEYHECLPLSRKLKPALWFAMHDITPRVEAERQVVYCHNPAPFFKMRAWEARLDPVVTAFTMLYRYLYGVGIRRNCLVIVQQQWMRAAFQQRYRPRAVVVAHPSVTHLDEFAATPAPHYPGEPWRFFYPCLPRVFKNVQVLLEAAEWLEKNSKISFEVALTLSGTEHAYARWLYRRFSRLQSVLWLGRLSRAEVFAQYHLAHAMLFPSRLETWGVPLSEFRLTGKPIFAADLPYAHETLAGYASTHFFDPCDGVALGQAMLRWMDGDLPLQGAAAFVPSKPFTENWEQLFSLVLNTATSSERSAAL